MSGDYSTIVSLDATETEALRRILDHLKWSYPEQRLTDEQLESNWTLLRDRLDAGTADALLGTVMCPYCLATDGDHETDCEAEDE